ncbi:RagB/SusD family nutrient uptake outer membrane protein [Chitinophaga sp. Cy-1792]|uniref:RagB/SusD family nutrient uptake outer membrane protein n=1 Tax=Chitinophaga sp. Cy-1792 TaxID=2608339 RepID=UPI0014240E38|nr:RagB/SusD family nutrient uptake outer membrane protein [Chitinophaga sp. Cy-1792]NIG52699.1 RagB/SusD family nutrient uptake outer membrane protein [Chitinophaga sp. Cy-1792]
MNKFFQYKYNKNAGRVLAATLVISASLMSCSKYTELTPKDRLGESSIFTDSTNVELALNGVYNNAAVGSYADSYSSGRGYPFGAASIEQAEMRGEDMVNLATFYDITYRSVITTTSANNVAMWVNLYALINQANVFIEGAQLAQKNGIISDAKEKQVEAEARFLRALAHHEAVLNFSRPYADNSGATPGIPYRDVAINSVAKTEAALKVSRGTVKETYTKILADLDWAEQNIGDGKASINKVSKGAIIALKSRIKLHMADYAGVIAEATKLGANLTSPVSPIGNYKLEALPETVFANNEINSESIFSIANSILANGGTNGALAPMFGPGSVGARGLVSMSPNLYSASWWVAGDRRRDKMTIKGGDGRMYSAKFTKYVDKSDWAPIVRYAEVLLNAAEAYSRTGNASQALTLLNVVRDRSVPAAASYSKVPPADLTLAILRERRIEFFSEGRRWPDIHRLAFDATYGFNGIPGKVPVGDAVAANFVAGAGIYITPKVDAIPYTDYRYVWPFPNSEVIANPTLKAEQNPGY